MEILEPRLLMADMWAPGCLVSNVKSTLHIQARDSEVWVGDASAGLIGVTCFDKDSLAITLDVGFKKIRGITVSGGPGDDHIGFDFDGRRTLVIDVSTGAGADTVEASFNKVLLPTSIIANLGDGDDWMTVDVLGNVSNTFNMNVAAGSGNDYVGLTCHGQIVSGRTSIRASLGDGDDEFEVYIESDRRAKAPTPTVEINGGAGDDRLVLDRALSLEVFEITNRSTLLSPLVELVLIHSACRMDEAGCR